MTRGTNRVGVDAVETDRKDTPVDAVDELNSEQVGANADRPDQAAERKRLQLQKELLRKKKAERRAHAKQRQQQREQQKQEEQQRKHEQELELELGQGLRRRDEQEQVRRQEESQKEQEPPKTDRESWVEGSTSQLSCTPFEMTGATGSDGVVIHPGKSAAAANVSAEGIFTLDQELRAFSSTSERTDGLSNQVGPMAAHDQLETVNSQDISDQEPTSAASAEANAVHNNESKPTTLDESSVTFTGSAEKLHMKRTKKSSPPPHHDHDHERDRSGSAAAESAATTIQHALKRKLLRKTRKTLRKARSYIRLSARVLAEESIESAAATTSLREDTAPLHEQDAFAHEPQREVPARVVIPPLPLAQLAQHYQPLCDTSPSAVDSSTRCDASDASPDTSSASSPSSSSSPSSPTSSPRKEKSQYHTTGGTTKTRRRSTKHKHKHSRHHSPQKHQNKRSTHTTGSRSRQPTGGRQPRSDSSSSSSSSSSSCSSSCSSSSSGEADASTAPLSHRGHRRRRHHHHSHGISSTRSSTSVDGPMETSAATGPGPSVQLLPSSSSTIAGCASRSAHARQHTTPTTITATTKSRQRSSAAPRYGDLHHFMATRIQARVRGHYGRRLASTRASELAQEIHADALAEVELEASIRIQAQVRGLLARRRYHGASPATRVTTGSLPGEQPPRSRRSRRPPHHKAKRHSVQPLPFPLEPTQPQPVPPQSEEEAYSHESNSAMTEPVTHHREEDRATTAHVEDVVELWPSELRLDAVDDWDELNSVAQGPGHANGHGDRVTHARFLSRNRLRVFCGTWNLHATRPRDDLRKWVALNRYHIVAIGTEECVHSIATSVLFTSKQVWETQLRATLGPEYVLLAAHALTAIHNVVFVHESLLPYVHGIQSDAVATGLGNQLGNKGGVGIAFAVGGTSFAFVNCHFDAHQNRTAKRNANFHRINRELRLFPPPRPTTNKSAPTKATAAPPSVAMAASASVHPLGLGRIATNRFSPAPSSVDPTVTSTGTVSAAAHKRGGGHVRPPLSDAFDRVFWLGDLNYRINGTRRMIDRLLALSHHSVLYSNDQLQLEMARGHVFEGFQEGPLHFRPTYKFDKHSMTYDSSPKQRIPSWTDRILYRCNDQRPPADPRQGQDQGQDLGQAEGQDQGQGISLLSYRSEMSFQTSDHRPVGAVFDVGAHIHEDAETARADATGKDEFSRVLARGYRANAPRSEVCSLQ